MITVSKIIKLFFTGIMLFIVIGCVSQQTKPVVVEPYEIDPPEHQLTGQDIKNLVDKFCTAHPKLQKMFSDAVTEAVAPHILTIQCNVQES